MSLNLTQPRLYLTSMMGQPGLSGQSSARHNAQAHPAPQTNMAIWQRRSIHCGVSRAQRWELLTYREQDAEPLLALGYETATPVELVHMVYRPGEGLRIAFKPWEVRRSRDSHSLRRPRSSRLSPRLCLTSCRRLSRNRRSEPECGFGRESSGMKR